MLLGWWVGLVVLGFAGPGDGEPVTVRVRLRASSEVDVAEVVARLAEASGVSVAPPRGPLWLPLTGRAGPLTQTLLRETLGPDPRLEVKPDELVVDLPGRLLEPAQRDAWERRLTKLADRASREVERRSRYGLHSRASYRPNDRDRPTVCLIHGLNSTSSVFLHMIGPLEAAGYGVVVVDFPYNRDLDETSSTFRDDWRAFRLQANETRPWAIVAHSMGSLLARAYVEDPASFAHDVSSMILIAPPNQGSTLARAQTVLQTLQSVQALHGSKRTDPLSLLGDGVGMAADDMTPGSLFLRTLNARARPEGVLYHTLAGDSAYLSVEARRQWEARARGGGVLGGVGRLVTSGVSASLDEITDGSGDGCVSVSSTRLAGVTDHRILHANHLELIRAPLLFPEPGPVASMPDLLRWLQQDTGRILDSGVSKK